MVAQVEESDQIGRTLEAQIADDRIVKYRVGQVLVFHAVDVKLGCPETFEGLTIRGQV